MEAISSGISKSINLLSTIGLADILDILIVAYLIYQAIWFIRRTNSYNVAKGLILLLIVMGLSYIFGLTMINFLLRKALELGLIALVVLFQPELRRVLERMGRSFTTSRTAASPVIETAIAQIVLACTDMSASRTGALIVFERRISLNTIMSSGTLVNADATAELIKNIFYNKAPLHDGAMIVRDGRIAAAGCVLPLTKSVNLSKELGMRHRAGIGMSEQSDAVVVIVSEETGSISVAIDGALKRHLTAASLDKILHNELASEEAERSTGVGIFNNIKNFFKGNENENEPSEKNL